MPHDLTSNQSHVKLLREKVRKYHLALKYLDECDEFTFQDVVRASDIAGLETSESELREIWQRASMVLPESVTSAFLDESVPADGGHPGGVEFVRWQLRGTLEKGIEVFNQEIETRSRNTTLIDSSKVTVSCVKCNKRYSVESKLCGKWFRCKNCAAKNRIPFPEVLETDPLPRVITDKDQIIGEMTEIYNDFAKPIARSNSAFGCLLMPVLLGTIASCAYYSWTLCISGGLAMIGVLVAILEWLENPHKRLAKEKALMLGAQHGIEHKEMFDTVYGADFGTDKSEWEKFVLAVWGQDTWNRAKQPDKSSETQVSTELESQVSVVRIVEIQVERREL